VTISNPNVNPTGLEAELESGVLDPNQQVDNACEAVGSSTFTVMGRGGLPDNPTAPRPGQSIWSDLRDLSEFRQSGAVQLPPLKTVSRYTEATGMRIDANGEITLVAEPEGLNAGAFLAHDCGASLNAR
jgi:large exoprotein involved in heme utilization and adhesion